MALANECQPYIEDSGQPRLTCHAGDAITGKRIVKVKSTRQSGPALNTSTDGSNYVATPCSAGAAGFGVAAYDCADEGKVPVIHAPGTVLPITAGGTVTAGEFVQSDATGRAITANGGNIVGLCLGTATVGNDAEVLWYGATGGGSGGGAEAEAVAVTAPAITGTVTTVVGSAAAVTGTMTSVAITGTEDPTEAEFNTLVSDVGDLYTTVIALKADMDDVYTTLAALLADVTDLTTSITSTNAAVNAIITALEVRNIVAPN